MSETCLRFPLYPYVQGLGETESTISYKTNWHQDCCSNNHARPLYVQVGIGQTVVYLCWSSHPQG